MAGEQWPPEFEVAMRDLLEQMANTDREVTLHNLGRFLGDFVPRYTLDRAEEWQEWATRRWFSQTKLVLMDKLADVFIDTAGAHLYSSCRRHQGPVSLRPLGARSSHWYMLHNPSRPRA
ncbi:hypothetical protein D3C75_315340 [compost metagenome]|nr:hypothetical protein PS843_00182 [Pseudomonas fluorescens]